MNRRSSMLDQQRRFKSEYLQMLTVDRNAEAQGDDYDWSIHDPKVMFESLVWALDTMEDMDDVLLDIRRDAQTLLRAMGERRVGRDLMDDICSIRSRAETITPREYRRDY